MSIQASQQGLLQDWHRYSDGRPTRKAVSGALIFEAGFLTVFLFRLAQRMTRRGNHVRSRLIHRFNMIVSACELHPAAEVGPGLFLPHPYGVTIGRGSSVGRDVSLFQGVVLGARTVADESETKQTMYPRISDGVTLYPHVLAYGDISIGRGAVVLGNSVVTHDVPAKKLYGGVPAVLISTIDDRIDSR